LATMAKGPAGLLLPAAAAFFFVMASGRWRDLTRMEVIAGLLLFCVAALPWVVAMYARHGQTFIDKLLFDHMVKRAFGHMHDTNDGDDLSFRYYVWQLGYAAFPWTGLVPIALVRWARDSRHIGVVLGAWFLVGFALFAWMGTKFHHYCLPILPPAAMLTGVLLDDFMRRSDGPLLGAPLLGAVAVGAALCTLLIGRDLTGADLGPLRLLHLFTYNYDRPWPSNLHFTTELWVFTIAAAVLMLLLMVERLRRRMAIGLVALSLSFAVWGLDVFLVKLSPHWGQRELFIAYERERMAQPGQLIAYIMNWKGENFYRGNRVPAFVSTGHRFQRWIDDQKKKGDKTFYFVLQHTRVTTLAAELGEPAIEKLTDEALNNKFVLVRVRFP
ncbi:MAG TPA: glycosyltransferase family 39 protein, partial [Polyangiaceae bacterium]|nr:glycosyltransferase family 39 protein [Polyangiaceae bacterium]